MVRCIKGLEVNVCSSAAGFYIGVFNDEGPYCRMSAYYASRKLAHIDLDTFRVEERHAAEVEFCNSGKGCGLVRTEA